VAASHTIDALGQFRLTTALGPVGASVNFTQSNLFMVIAGILTLGLLWLGMRPKAMVPGRLQALAEMAYEGILSMCTETIGPEGRKFFPLVFTIFFFVLVGNLLGVFPYFFTYTSHIAVTGTLTIFVVVLVTIVGLAIHRLHFFSYFFPAGAPVLLAPLLIPIEILSYLSRLVSLSVRLFANMVAGHVMLEVLASFIVILGGLGWLGWLPAGLSFVIDVILIGFELLVAFLQAYVFAILTCIYLHDAVHLH
jgi:F-type H+-transporting ATPase subunit a